MSEQAIDRNLVGKILKIYDDHPDCTARQMKDLFFETYGSQYSEKEYEKADKYILDMYSKDI
mgnify:CR=1 FL=1